MSTLYLVGTPIGNLSDITYRAVETLKRVDLIACEDTRVTQKLCQHYEIHTPLKPYHDHNKEKETMRLITKLKEGCSIALVSDAGLPLISDPGYELVVAAREHGLSVETVPGPNAGLTALMASGLPSFTYTFIGFLPRKEKDKLSILKQRMYEDSTLIIYESPYRVEDSLKAIMKVDETRQISIGRELTKRFEQVETGQVNDLLDAVKSHNIPLKGEFVILVEGAPNQKDHQWFEEMSVTEHVEFYKAQNMKPKAAIKAVAKDREAKTSEIYNIYHEI
ncbi:16S rRNA (cytidine(1402)-2'-O)-methyltransferase [Staphylococcus sp. SQ8-PEA]|uniref:Ribosomal RNA small subunit methyltransferase I n=1 Tax=Staphylococcus marylandisciuri TaxID=2981529 RepID=A0ABT2QSY0_9STAP|nr:16S rRNA (cytidine(1402)-2'-O)-methyltransferase [Staphylococcus marylandisciuri]MCU5747054.1 16S rRNA (cytidine(1402)-2'-O)-methyltransferase [Staphylococcus marylandisciuri]